MIQRALRMKLRQGKQMQRSQIKQTGPHPSSVGVSCGARIQSEVKIVMWRFVLTVTLLSWGSDGAVTCKNENDADVHWYILYKAPNLPKKQLTGLEYVYIDSGGARKMVSSTENYKSIKHPNGVLANTLRPLFIPIRSMPSTFGFISYSDQPPGCSASKKFGHSKGVLMMDSSIGGTGVWLMHSTPQFPFRRDQNNFWPNSGENNAQIFICVTFQYSEFRKIGMHLQDIGAFPFEYDLPVNFHQELKDAVNWVQSPPLNNFRELTSTDLTQKFYSIGKQQSNQPKVGDLYVTIAQGLDTDLKVQTWGCQRDRLRSYCVSGIHKVLNVKSILTHLGNWQPQHDHSKWCVAQDQTKHWTCIADVNRAITQYERRGGALCFENEEIQKMFLQFSRGIEDCSDLNIMDVTECEPDPDTDMGPSLMG
ncbi:deoxyribonuclease-2-beta-like [Halichoeres trimaculatus]|uniref:deoxyribonuclease-2-beta-like n=1 Tax=Halichoeres trimaculatus TaxID=147232 RepID=UPI003D9F3540